MSTKIAEKDGQAEAPCLTILDNQPTPSRLFHSGAPMRDMCPVREFAYQ
jgi:hypothetical protein